MTTIFKKPDAGKSKQLIGLLLLALPLVLTACGDAESGKPQNALDPEGPDAQKIDELWDAVFPIAVGVFFLVQGLILWAIFRYRRRGDDDAPVQTHGSAKLEIGWTALPAAILAVVAVFTVGTVLEINERPKDPSSTDSYDVIKVNVIGHQWWWEYEYPELGITTANELVIPVGKRVDITLSSVDVIHNFWVPKLAGKVYAIPGDGNENHMAIEAPEAKIYSGQCAEFCGLSHANMRLRVEAMEEDDFRAWVAAQEAGPTDDLSEQAELGLRLFQQEGCAGCHTVEGVSIGKVGPDLTHLYSRKTFAGSLFALNDENMRRWLRNPPEEKPGSQMPNLELGDAEVTALMAYLRTLK